MLSAGTSALLSLGATPLTSAADVFETLGIASPEPSRAQVGEVAASLLEQLPASVDELVRASGLPRRRGRSSVSGARAGAACGRRRSIAQSQVVVPNRSHAPRAEIGLREGVSPSLLGRAPRVIDTSAGGLPDRWCTSRTSVVVRAGGLQLPGDVDVDQHAPSTTMHRGFDALLCLRSSG